MVYLGADFHQFLQVNDLMVTPIADVCPRVMRFGELPFDPLTRNSIWVVSVGCGRVQERSDHAFDIFRVGISKRFPVLENVAPVALIVELARAVGLLHVDGKTIPGPARIAVTAAKR